MAKEQSELFKAEEAYLKETLDFIESYIAFLENDMQKREAENQELKQTAYETSLELAEEDSNKQYDSAVIQNTLHENYNFIREEKALLQVLKKLYPRPYFGHISFQFSDEDKPSEIYIGLKDLLDTENYKQYVVDWRAPVANLYYNDDHLGRVSYDTKTRTIVGDLLAKYQIQIEDAELINVLDTKTRINDELLQEVLSEMSSATMENIVATIQAEQNRIIRAEPRRTLIVQGVAGSGKTSIALHRAAYLLYLNEDLRAEDMLLISPSASFANYISKVLPSLGERNVYTDNINDLMQAELGDDFMRFKDYKFVPATQEKLNIFSRSEIPQYVDEFVKIFENAVFRPQDIEIEDEFYLSSKEILRLYKLNYGHHELYQRKDLILNHIKDLINDKTIFAEYKEELETKLNSMFAIDDIELVFKVFLNWLKQSKGISLDYFAEPLDRVDLGLLTLLKIKLYGKSDTTWVKHLIIDEMQDLSFVEHEILRILYHSPRTILGDENQAVKFPLEAAYVDKLANIYKKDSLKVETFRLNKTYRSTIEISDFSKKIISADYIQAIDRHGEEVELIELAPDENEKLLKDIYKTLLAWRERGLHTAAVISNNPEELANFEAQLKDLMHKDQEHKDLHLNHYLKESKDFAVTICDIENSKGIEFDGVIILNANQANYNSELDKTKLYVATTRPLHLLKIYTLGQKSKFLEFA